VVYNLRIIAGKRQLLLLIAFINAGLAAVTLAFGYDYQLIRPVMLISIFLFCVLCWLELSNILFCARTFILGFIGYFPMIIKVTLGEDAFFSGYERSTQGFDIVVLMYVTTSFSLLSNQIGLALVKKRSLPYPNKNPLSIAQSPQKRKKIRKTYWRIAGFIGVILAFYSSYTLIRGAGKTIFAAAYNSVEQGGAGIPFGSVIVLGAVGIFSLSVAGMKRYIKNWKIIFFITCLVVIIYSNLLMGGRLEAMSILFGLVILYGVVNKKEIGLKLSYIPVLVVAYIFFEAWGVARFALAGGVPITTIITEAFTNIGSTDAIQMGTISPIATTFSNTVWLVQNNVINYSFGQSYWEWILRIPPEALYLDRPIDYAWMFQEYGLLAGGGFFELAEVYMNFGLLGALIIPGIISFLIAKSYYYAFYRQSMLSYFLLFAFLSIFLRGTWYQTFAFFRAFLVCMLLYFIYIFIVQILLPAIKKAASGKIVTSNIH
jgi:oligosaccharide repeat unit polymerase